MKLFVGGIRMDTAHYVYTTVVLKLFVGGKNMTMMFNVVAMLN